MGWLLKFLIISLMLSTGYLLNPLSVNAITSNSVVTKVGNPSGPPPNQGSSAIVNEAARIASLLALGPNNEGFYVNGVLQNWYNVKTDELGTYYWCNFLVADSYSAAGFPLNRQNSFGYSHLVNYFKSTPGLEFLDASTPVEKVKPGAVAFFGSDSLFHVSVVYAINVDSDGDGTIGTYDSNNVVIKDVITVRNHIAQNANSTKNLYTVTGFGQPTGG